MQSAVEITYNVFQGMNPTEDQARELIKRINKNFVVIKSAEKPVPINEDEIFEKQKIKDFENYFRSRKKIKLK